jgi:hypothetical protein
VDGKLIEHDRIIAGHALTADQEVSLDIIQSRDVQLDAAQAYQVACRGCVGAAGDECAMHGHRLRRVFNAAGAAEASVRAQRIICIAMRRSAALDARAIPTQHAIEQAHLAGVRNVGFDPVTI